jgi:hypothetical protein
MKRVLTEPTIVMELADEICRRIARRVMRALQGMTGHGLSGDDSGLKNTWDEICVQIQFEQSIFWDAYEYTVTSLVAGYTESLKPSSARPSGSRVQREFAGVVRTMTNVSLIPL